MLDDEHAPPDQLAEMPMSQALRSIGVWAQQSFGRPDSLTIAAARVGEEMAELMEAAARADEQATIEEAADIVITLAHLARGFGLDLGAAIADKMQVNRKREWRLHGDGTAHHVKKSSHP